MSIVNRPGLLAHLSQNPRDSWPEWTDTPINLGPVVPSDDDLSPRWRSLAVTTRSGELDQLDGYGSKVLANLIRLAYVEHRSDRAEALAAGDIPAEFAAVSSDLVVWDGNRVVAVLRVLPDGSLEDNRFSRTGFLVDPCDSVREGGDL